MLNATSFHRRVDSYFENIDDDCRWNIDQKHLQFQEDRGESTSKESTSKMDRLRPENDQLVPLPPSNIEKAAVVVFSIYQAYRVLQKKCPNSRNSPFPKRCSDNPVSVFFKWCSTSFDASNECDSCLSLDLIPSSNIDNASAPMTFWNNWKQQYWRTLRC